MKEAKKVQVTKMICEQARLMRKGGASQSQVAELLGVNPCTVSRIEKAGFDLATYNENRRIRKEKEKRQAEEPKAELPGQIEMQLTPEEPEKPELSDQVKMMRFQAHEADLIIRSIEETGVMVRMMLDKLNDTMCMILRAVRKE